MKALIPQLADFEGLLIGANAETDLNCAVLKAEIKAPCPPILKPVTEILVRLTGK